MKFFSFNKKPTYEQHDNDKINYYQSSSLKPELKTEFKGNCKIDICVIGGGFTGIASALYLAEKGYKVMLLN